MKRTLIQSIILIIIIIISSIIIISGTIKAQPPTVVKGYVYIDDIITMPEDLSLTFPSNTYMATLYDDGRYIIVFSGIENGSIGSFTIVYHENSYTPPETITILEGESLYSIDVHITLSEDEEQSEESDEVSTLQPKANAGGPYSGLVGDSIQFDGSDSYDTDGDIHFYQWWFGDGSLSTLKTPTHTYTKAGNFTVTLTVTDDDDETDEDLTFVVVSTVPNTPPNIPTISGVNTSHIHLVCSYVFNGSDADGDLVRYIITWDDGTNDTVSSLFPANTSFSTEHYWTTGGIYHVAAYTEDEHNATSPLQTFEVLIDVHACGSLGSLIDKNGDGVYDVFYQETTGIETLTEQYNDLYNIDITNDGQWDYTYDPVTQELLVYQSPESGHSNLFSITDFDMTVMLLILGLIGGILCIGIIVKLTKWRPASTPKLFYMREHSIDHDKGEPSAQIENPDDSNTARQPDDQQFLEDLRHHMEQMKKEE